MIQDGYWQGGIWGCNKNGVERLYHLSTTSVTNSEGFVTHYVSIFRDITEQKQIEKDLCVAAIAFEAQEGIIIADANKTIISANKSFCRSTGYDEAEIIGNPLFFLHSSLHDEQFFAELWATVARQGYWRGELWKKRKNNQLFPVFQTVSAIAFDGGAVSFYVSSFTDITVQKQAEKILQETQARLASQVATTQEELDKIRHETEEVNTALSVLLRHKEISVLESQNQLTRQLETTVLPFLKQLQGLVAGQQQSSQLADIIEANLHQMLASYGRPGNLAAAYFKLTPVEAQVASMIRQGLPTKVIATTLNNSPGTISNHRKSIRKKLGFGKNTGNLQAYLLSLSE